MLLHIHKAEGLRRVTVILFEVIDTSCRIAQTAERWHTVSIGHGFNPYCDFAHEWVVGCTWLVGWLVGCSLVHSLYLNSQKVLLWWMFGHNLPIALDLESESRNLPFG